MEASNIMYLIREARKNKHEVVLITIQSEKIKLDVTEKIEIVDRKTLLYGDTILINVECISIAKIMY